MDTSPNEVWESSLLFDAGIVRYDEDRGGRHEPALGVGDATAYVRCPAMQMPVHTTSSRYFRVIFGLIPRVR
jgi:hypothetical protein